MTHPATTTAPDAPAAGDTDRKTIDDLRATLFDTLQALRAGTVDVAKARAINELAGTIVDTARVEVDFLRATGREQSEFLGLEHKPAAENRAALPPGITGVHVHRIRG